MKCIEDEIPFEVPEGWAWERMQNLTCKIGAGSTPTGGNSVYSQSGIKFIRSQNVYEDGLILDDIAYISEEINKKKSGSIVKPKDILLNITGGSIGRCALVPDDFDIGNVNQHVLIVRLVNLELRSYIHLLITSSYIQKQICDKQVGSGRGGLSAATFSSFLMPIPPENEQSKIQGFVSNILEKVISINTEKLSLKELIDKSKAQILDLAIRGKLVPQNPNDEPASVLLERIRAEKEELIKAGKIKRDKKESIIFRGEDNSYYRNRKGKLVIIDNELPMKIPNTWTWAMLPEIVFFQEGPGILKKDFREKGIPLIRISGLQTDSVSLDGCNYLEPKMVDKKWSHFKLDKGDVILCTSASIGKASIVGDEAVGAVPYTGQIRFKMSDAMDRDYFLYLAISNVYLNQVNAMKTGNCIQHYGPTHLQEVYVPLPPLTEQKRIVTSIKKYINLLDKIESSLV